MAGQLTMFPNDGLPRPKKPRGRKGWTRIAGGCGGRWRHDASGWIVAHCGHPTALWPYTARDPEDTGILIPSGWYAHGVTWVKGYAFQTLERAQEKVESHLATLAKKGT
jgi:hypothetical protein